MKQTWRWFGPPDLVSTDDILQAGASGVVSALHHVPSGTVWEPAEIEKRKAEIGRRRDGSPSGLTWDVVESLAVSEDIKRQTGAWRAHVANYRQSLENLAAAGGQVVCYNFMPVLDWTRTDLAWRLAHGGTCMRFDLTDFAVFDIHVLGRAGAADDFPPAVAEEAERRFLAMDAAARAKLADNIVCGLPGTDEHLTMDGVRTLLDAYGAIDTDRLRANFITFLEEVIPTAERVGIRMCCHPDDPPFPLLGLPRVMSTVADFATIVRAVDSPANGITLCSGSLGSRPDNDLVAMVEQLGERIHFVHLRNVTRDTDATVGSFYEAEHLGGDTDMVALIGALLREETRRRAAGRSDHQIPMRPDHGQDLLDDLGRPSQPGYPSIGRLRGLAELRGVMTALAHPSM
ncbi:MAG: mannonate dehydratase [Alphaproteobacteria bacterium]